MLILTLATTSDTTTVAPTTSVVSTSDTVATYTVETTTPTSSTYVYLLVEFIGDISWTAIGVVSSYIVIR